MQEETPARSEPPSSASSGGPHTPPEHVKQIATSLIGTPYEDYATDILHRPKLRSTRC